MKLIKLFEIVPMSELEIALGQFVLPKTIGEIVGYSYHGDSTAVVLEDDLGNLYPVSVGFVSVIRLDRSLPEISRYDELIHNGINLMKREIDD